MKTLERSLSRISSQISEGYINLSEIHDTEEFGIVKEAVQMYKDEKHIRTLNVGDVVIHFKHEIDLEDDISKYLYTIIEFAKYTESDQVLVIYQNQRDGEVYARPYDMFMSEVDREKYPEIKQKFRFEFYKVKGK